MRVNSRVKLNFGRMKQLSQAAVTALEQTAEALHAEVVQAQVVPFDQGTLQGQMFVDDSESSQGRVVLVHSTPYARRMYYHPEYNFQTSENPDAKGHWFEDWEPGGKKEKFAPNAFKEIYKRVGGV